MKYFYGQIFSSSWFIDGINRCLDKSSLPWPDMTQWKRWVGREIYPSPRSRTHGSFYLFIFFKINLKHPMKIMRMLLFAFISNFCLTIPFIQKNIYMMFKKTKTMHFPTVSKLLVQVYFLTHWGRVTHICVNKLTIIGSDNGLSPGRRQAIIWTNDGILLIGPLGTKCSEILIEI